MPISIIDKGADVLRNPYEPNVYGVGFMGEGIHKSKINGKTTREYHAWHSMMDRCYNSKHSERYPTYAECEVCEAWHNFQTFAAWYDDNYYEIEGQRMCLDKDILEKGNKVYGPDTCVYAPNYINSLFVKSDATRGDFPIGVTRIAENKYVSRLDVRGKRRHLGYYETPEEAFFAYKSYKERYIKQVADEYKDLIPQRLYDAMYEYEVEYED